MPKTDAPPAEDAVRSYLTFLDDPSTLVDEAEVKKLQAAVDKATDPIDRLMTRAALLRAQTADEHGLKRDFVQNAKKWADAEGIPVSAFRTFGVPDDVLADAGLDGAKRRGRGASASTGPKNRRPRVSVPDLEAGILGLEGTFSIRDVANQVGGSPVTVKSAVERLEAQAKLKAAGDRAGNRGRAAKVWQVA